MAHDRHTLQAHEFQGKTVDDAIAQGLASLGLNRDQVEIEVLHKGSRGIFGIGSEPAHVRISVPVIETIEEVAPSTTTAPIAEDLPDPTVDSGEQIPEADIPIEESAEPLEPKADIDEAVTDEAGIHEASVDKDALTSVAESTAEAIEATADDVGDTKADEAELVQMSAALLDEMIDLMGFDAEVEAGWQEANEVDGEPYLLLNATGPDLSPLIGRRGEVLDSIQYLLRLMVNQRVKQWKNIVVDIDQHKQRRVAQLTQLAHRMAQQVAESGRSMPLEPMSSMERRIVHLTLRDHPDVITESHGEGERRKVHILRRS